eukprot:161866-Pelagomonas_calceolata.AAC.1
MNPLQIVRLCLLKHILGVMRTTPNWPVLRECGHEPKGKKVKVNAGQQPACIQERPNTDRFLRSKSTTLSKVLQVDGEMSSLSHGLGQVQHVHSLCLVWAAYNHEGVRY